MPGYKEDIFLYWQIVGRADRNRDRHHLPTKPFPKNGRICATIILYKTGVNDCETPQNL